MEENKKVMFVSTKETLITNGLLGKIKAAGREPFYAYSMADVTAHTGDLPGAIVYYMDDDVAECATLHSAIDELCEAAGLKVICVGTKEQYDAFLKNFAAERVADFFTRPLNMDAFIKCVLDGGAGTAAQRKRVLIVDDDTAYRQLVREWLKGRYDVAMANGGSQAIAILSTQKCDLVLLDYEMPIVAGPQVMEMIRELPETGNIPIIFLTGKDDEASIRRVLELHPEGYLLKTVTDEALLKKVEEVLAGQPET